MGTDPRPSGYGHPSARTDRDDRCRISQVDFTMAQPDGMTARRCPNCAIFNVPDAVQCDCGYNFSEQRYPATGRPPGVTAQRLARFFLGSVALPIILLRIDFAMLNGSPSGISILVGVAMGAANLRACRFGLWSSAAAIVAYCIAVLAILFFLSLGIACGVYGNCL